MEIVIAAVVVALGLAAGLVIAALLLITVLRAASCTVT